MKECSVMMNREEREVKRAIRRAKEERMDKLINGMKGFVKILFVAVVVLAMQILWVGLEQQDPDRFAEIIRTVSGFVMAIWLTAKVFRFK